MSIFKDQHGITYFGAFAVGATALLILMGGLVWGIDKMQAKSCVSQASVLDVKHDYGFWSGCVYQDPVTKEWVPADNFRVRPGQ